MSNLSTLKLTDARKPMQVAAVVQRRNKLIRRIWQQTELARAQQAGQAFTVKRYRSYTDKHTGLRHQVETDVRVKPWWYTTATGKLVVSVRYGSRVLELAKNKFAVEVGNDADLIATLDVIKSAVAAGELDAQIDAAAMQLRVAFAK